MVQLQQGHKPWAHLNCIEEAARNILGLKFIPDNKRHHVSTLPSLGSCLCRQYTLEAYPVAQRQHVVSLSYSVVNRLDP